MGDTEHVPFSSGRWCRFPNCPDCALLDAMAEAEDTYRNEDDETREHRERRALAVWHGERA